MKTYNELVQEFKDSEESKQYEPYTWEYSKACDAYIAKRQQEQENQSEVKYVAYRKYMGGHNVAKVIELDNGQLHIVEISDRSVKLNGLTLSDNGLSFDSGVFGYEITFITKEQYEVVEDHEPIEVEPIHEVYETVKVTEHISDEDYETVMGNSKSISDTFWNENPKTYEVNLDETKRLLDEMHSYHPFPKNYFRSIEPREMQIFGNWRDKRFEKLQKQLIITMNHCSEEQKNKLVRHIRNLSYGKQ